MADKKVEFRRQECDVRFLLDRVAEPVTDYTRKRIKSSFDLLPLTLSACADLKFESALDVGCGGGFDSFALAAVFDRVTAFDTDYSAIEQAGNILKQSGCDHLSFSRDSAESFSLDIATDLVYCNLMSHNVESRLSLLDRFRTVLKPDGWLIYSEISEAYPAREIGLALAERDGKALLERLCQLQAGFTGAGGFRFFDSASLEHTLASYGFRVSHEMTTRWVGLPQSRQVWAKPEQVDSIPSCEGADYVELLPDFAEMKSVFVRELDQLKHLGVRSGDVLAALPLENRFFPFLYLLKMFRVMGFSPCLGPGEFRASRLVKRFLRWHRSKNLPWDTLEALYDEFKSTVEDRENT